MKFIDRIKSFLGFDAEGSWRGPFYGLGHLGNVFSLGRIEDGYQRDLERMGKQTPTAARFAAVSLYSDAVALMPGRHMVANEGGGAVTAL